MSDIDHAAPNTESVNTSQTIRRCKHDTEMVNAVDERLKKALAILDLLMSARPHNLASDTVSCAAWAAFDLVDEAIAFVDEKQEVQP